MRIKTRRLLSAGHRRDTHHFFCSDFIGQNSVLLLLLFIFKEIHILFWPQGSRDLSSLTRIEPVTPAEEAWSLNY